MFSVKRTFRTSSEQHCSQVLAQFFRIFSSFLQYISLLFDFAILAHESFRPDLFVNLYLELSSQDQVFMHNMQSIPIFLSFLSAVTLKNFSPFSRQLSSATAQRRSLRLPFFPLTHAPERVRSQGQVIPSASSVCDSTYVCFLPQSGDAEQLRQLRLHLLQCSCQRRVQPRLQFW